MCIGMPWMVSMCMVCMYVCLCVCFWTDCVVVDWGNALQNDMTLQESCVESWDPWICSLGNVSGLCSAVFWSFVLVPQIWHNYSRKSTSGLSLRWAFANVTAALININFVLRVHVPLYITITAIYMPILELFIMLQFVFFGVGAGTKYTALLLLVVLLLSTAVVIARWNEVSTEVSGALMWGAVVLWSIETFPQLWINAQRKSTGGQATETIAISFLGKTTDFISMVSLNLPLQFRVMTYFSTCSAYINIIQFLYYRDRKTPAVVVYVLILTYSMAMSIKIGVALACLVAVIFLCVLVGGYIVDKKMCPAEDLASMDRSDGADDLCSNLLPDKTTQDIAT